MDRKLPPKREVFLCLRNNVSQAKGSKEEIMERIEYFAQEIAQRDKNQELAKNIVSDHNLWVKTYEEIAKKAWRKLEKRVLDVI